MLIESPNVAPLCLGLETAARVRDDHTLLKRKTIITFDHAHFDKTVDAFGIAPENAVSTPWVVCVVPVC